MPKLPVRAFVLLAALVAAAVSAACVPAEDGGLVPGALLVLALSARFVRRRTSPEWRRSWRGAARTV